jgi:hypothetical protein
MAQFSPPFRVAFEVLPSHATFALGDSEVGHPEFSHSRNSTSSFDLTILPYGFAGPFTQAFIPCLKLFLLHVAMIFICP